MTETSAPWTRTIARALKDQAFKSRLLADPVATLKEAGVAVPDGLAIKVVENTANEVHMVLPDYPAADPLSDTELERIATGSLQDRTINEAPPYGLVRHWLGKEAVERLLDYAQSNEHRFEDFTIRDGWGSRKVDQTHRISRMMKLPDAGELASELKAKVECLLPIMFETLGCDPFTPHKYEMELVAHGNGAFFAEHLDTVPSSDRIDSHRAVSAVYYFHATPKAFAGGALRLHSLGTSGQQGIVVDVPPENDMFVYFSSWLPHEVLRIDCPNDQFLASRFAINVWIHRSYSF